MNDVAKKPRWCKTCKAPIAPENITEFCTTCYKHMQMTREQQKHAQQSQEKNEPADKFDAGKPRFDLIPVVPLRELAKLYGQGARKYGERNWEKGMSFSRCYAALLRHLTAFWEGELVDEETGVHHTTAVAFWAFALREYCAHATGIDDRPRIRLIEQDSE